MYEVIIEGSKCKPNVDCGSYSIGQLFPPPRISTYIKHKGLENHGIELVFRNKQFIKVTLLD